MLIWCYLTLCKESLKDKLVFFHNSMAASWSAHHEFQILNLSYTWICLVICEGMCLYVCLFTGVYGAMKFHLLKSQIFLHCVSVFFCWQICIDPSNKESFQGRWAAMASLLGLVFFHNPIWGSYCTNVFLVHYLPTKTSTFFLWSSLIRSWSWISNVDMHKRKTATKVG
jgi:hypothetical protein